MDQVTGQQNLTRRRYLGLKFCWVGQRGISYIFGTNCKNFGQIQFEGRKNEEISLVAQNNVLVVGRIWDEKWKYLMHMFKFEIGLMHVMKYGLMNAWNTIKKSQEFCTCIFIKSTIFDRRNPVESQYLSAVHWYQKICKEGVVARRWFRHFYE